MERPRFWNIRGTSWEVWTIRALNREWNIGKRRILGLMGKYNNRVIKNNKEMDKNRKKMSRRSTWISRIRGRVTWISRIRGRTSNQRR